MGTVTYPQPIVRDLIEEYTVPVKIDGTAEENRALVARFRAVWTPDLRVLDTDAYELYHWNGYLPPAEFAAQLLVAVAHARLRSRDFKGAGELFKLALTLYPTAFVAAEAQYFVAVSAYRSYTTFLIGQLLLEVAARGAELHPDEAILDGEDRPSAKLSDYPHLQRLQASLSEDHSAAEFEDALEALLDRLEMLVARR